MTPPSNPASHSGGRGESVGPPFDLNRLYPVINTIDSNQGAIRMANKHVDEGKGRIKEAAGSLSGDRGLKNEGTVDRGKATVKDKVDKVADTVSARKK
jgi:uncharacterized protein YjbJ (UPF0337 family)